MGLADLQTVRVRHCNEARAVSVTFLSGFKISYSGDCRPSKSFARIGQGSTVLVHEATFDDELKGDAIAKLHSTTSEAIQVGLAMGAKRVILTHFSQRYANLPVMDTVGGPQQLQDRSSPQQAPAESMLATLADDDDHPDDEGGHVDE